MSTKRESGSYVQCLSCGRIYMTERKIPITKSVVNSDCPKCGWHKGLNCGEDELDIMEFYDPYLDKRFYEYNTK